MPRAAVFHLRLSDFRAYAAAELALDGRPVALWGPNGAGKTNLLEAVSLLAPGKGLRNAAAAEIGRRAPEGPAGRPWAVAAQAGAEASSAARLGTGLEPGAARRTVRVEGAAAAPGRLSEHLRLVWLSPAQDRLFLEAASERRRFLDRLTFAAEPAHAGHAAAYEGALRQRTRLLADARERGASPDPQWLAALEARMAESGEAVAAARARTVEALAEEIDARADRPFPQARLDLTGEWTAPSPDYVPRLAAALREGRARDAAAGRALAGPHRADLAVALRSNGRPAAEGSTGEQKALVLNLALAQAARLARASDAPHPILLLDEVAAHLDPDRRAALFDEIAALGLQAFLTGTDRGLFAGLEGRAQMLHVRDGEIEAG